MAEATTTAPQAKAKSPNGEPKPEKKKRKLRDMSNRPTYLLIGISPNDKSEETIQEFPSIGRARKWAEDSRPLLTRLYMGVRLLRVKEVPLSK